MLIAQQGRVGLTTSDLGLSRARQSLSFGISVRAGGFPEVFLLFGFVREGTTSVSVSINHSSGAPRGLPCSSRVKERRPVLRRHRERTRGFVDIDRADRDLIMIGGVANAAPRFVCTDGGQ